MKSSQSRIPDADSTLPAEIAQLQEALGDVVDRDSSGIWFQTPNDAFDGLKPLEIIERGEIDRLWNMVFQLFARYPNFARESDSLAVRVRDGDKQAFDEMFSITESLRRTRREC